MLAETGDAGGLPIALAAPQNAGKDTAMARRSLFRHILVPHDFSAQATVALTTAAQLAKEHGGKLSVLYVLVPF